MDQTLHRLAETFGIVTPIARQRKLPPPLRQMHQLILRHFAEHATAPEPRQLREWAHQLDIELGEALDQLVSVDLVETEPATAQLLGAYPFSAIPRGHKTIPRPRKAILRGCKTIPRPCGTVPRLRRAPPRHGRAMPRARRKVLRVCDVVSRRRRAMLRGRRVVLRPPNGSVTT